MNNTNYFPGQGILHLLLNQDNQNELPSPEPSPEPEPEIIYAEHLNQTENKIIIQLQNKIKDLEKKIIYLTNENQSLKNI